MGEFPPDKVNHNLDFADEADIWYGDAPTDVSEINKFYAPDEECRTGCGGASFVGKLKWPRPKLRQRLKSDRCATQEKDPENKNLYRTKECILRVRYVTGFS